MTLMKLRLDFLSTDHFGIYLVFAVKFLFIGMGKEMTGSHLCCKIKSHTKAVQIQNLDFSQI